MVEWEEFYLFGDAIQDRKDQKTTSARSAPAQSIPVHMQGQAAGDRHIDHTSNAAHVGNNVV